MQAPLNKQYVRALYLAAAKACAPDLRSDPVAIKDFRNEALKHLFPKKEHYNELTVPECDQLINFLNKLATGISINETINEKRQRMVACVMFNILQFALYRMDFIGSKFIIDGEYWDGEELREQCSRLFLKNKLPRNIRYYIFEKFGNNHINKLLVEGKYREKSALNSNTFYWHQARLEELNYLIQRLEQINNTYAETLTNVKCTVHSVN